MLRPDMCGPNASCKETNKKVATQWNYHQCVCNPGFVGNGITCVDASDLANGDSFFPLYLGRNIKSPSYFHQIMNIFLMRFCVRDHPFKTSACSRGGGVKNLPNLPTDSTKKLPTVGG